MVLCDRAVGLVIGHPAIPNFLNLVNQAQHHEEGAETAEYFS